MKKIRLLTAAAGIVLAFAGPTLAASRAHRGMDAYASGTADRSGAYYYGPRATPDRVIPPPQTQAVPYQYVPGQNLPYPDRPYGDPDRD